MPTADERAVLDQLADAPAPYLALERFVLGGDRALALGVVLRLAEEGKITLGMAGQPVAMSRLEHWAATPGDRAHTAELGALVVDITDAGIRESID